MNTEQLEASLVRVHDWIKAVDQKISIALVFEVGVLALIAKPTYDRVVNSIGMVGIIVELLLAVTLIVLSLSLIWSILALKPRTTTNYKAHSLIFFGSVAAMSLETFKSNIKKTTKSKYVDDLIEQIHINSKVAQRKHTLLAQSLTLFLIGAVLWLITLAVLAR